ncbi:uncharacterized protein LOC109194491 isoform X1 [Oreochromis niloticus]|uniref:uncharacterized protein LOC109194491 isoform X1 n=1 Tax=Oreochromis niloticus TaxID=8128 RepID=UPI000904C4F0|nr:uncharacterized protein LOC109194491 isoform X1 [Oreochromis niloticus]XP_025766285.1 uncharacterized protein LOC109194491 isoform X1 [Oreochromis niloticus]XP_025766286.1 uncharacterized protein LOC109194491 isoform X1 [Oreochromis niloticus]XP_025766287.1 uncharacterized protein LOC109194491 isoform X1 [Oreochromis niloticus]
MYGREAVFPSEVPAQVPISNIILPDDKRYSDYVQSESEAQHAVKETAQENIAKSQDKQKVAYAKQVLKKYKNVVYNVGDQILLLNMRKRGRKGGRLEPDFSGPYTIDDISGKCVGPKNAEGNTLKSLYSIDHIKPYRTSHPVQVSTPTEPVESSPSSEMQPCSPQHHPEALQNNRPSVIQFAPKIAQVKSVQAPEELVPVTPQKPSTQEKVKWLWAAKDTGRVEAVVGPYKLYDSSFRTLEDSGWLSDEVIDGYLHCLIRKQKEPVYQLSCVVATSLFSGKFKCVTKMLFPAEDIWLCPLNFGAHWILVVVKPNIGLTT